MNKKEKYQVKQASLQSGAPARSEIQTFLLIPFIHQRLTIFMHLNDETFL